MTTTTMLRNVRCTICGYSQTDRVSYYLHAKAWKANHDLDNCLSIRRSQNAFAKMFAESTTALANLTIIK
jgi:hypothetical protein